MIYNKKGFTLVELLSVIVLIGLLLGIGIPGISRISSNMKKKSLNTKIDLIEQSGIFWGQDNKAMLQSSQCFIDDDETIASCKKISINELISDDYLDSESYEDVIYKNPNNDINLANISCDDSNDVENTVKDNSCCVNVYKKNNRVYAHFGEKSGKDGLKEEP